MLTLTLDNLVIRKFLDGWKRILFILIVLAIAGVVSAACGDDEGGVASGPISGVGPGISIDEALTSNLKGPLLINGLLQVEDGQVRLCAVLAESFPPQCGGSFLVVKGLDLTKMDGLTSEGSVTWSDQPVQVPGTLKDEVLTVARTVR